MNRGREREKIKEKEGRTITKVSSKRFIFGQFFSPKRTLVGINLTMSQWKRLITHLLIKGFWLRVVHYSRDCLLNRICLHQSLHDPSFTQVQMFSWMRFARRIVLSSVIWEDGLEDSIIWAFFRCNSKLLALMNSNKMIPNVYRCSVFTSLTCLKNNI